MANRNEIGDRLREERVRYGFTQDMVAFHVGLNSKSQINYEKGIRNPNAEYLKKAAEIGLDIHYIITGERDETRIKTDHEMAYVELCRELPTPEARDLGMDAFRLVLKAWQPHGVPLSYYSDNGSGHRVRASDKGAYESLVNRFMRVFHEVLAPVYSGKKEQK